ncbi:MAG: hypothetical protein AB7V39_04365, partial [Nitrospiraceae bacterium]
MSSDYAAARRRHRRIYGPIHYSKARALFLIGKSKRDANPPRRETIRVWTVAGRKDIQYSIPERFRALFKMVVSFDALAVSIKGGRLVATLSVTLNPIEVAGTLPAGVAVGTTNEVAVVDSMGRSMRIITVAQNVMEETTRKTTRRLRERLTARKADGRETRSVRRVLKRLSRRRHMQTRTFAHTAAMRIVDWVSPGTIL